jgi:lysylphosphatidylglycerol synthetase-like protein (DUF2156 family)
MMITLLARGRSSDAEAIGRNVDSRQHLAYGGSLMAGTPMAALFLLSFAVGVALGALATVWQCVLAVLLLATFVLALALHDGVRLGTALLDTGGIFIGVQLGYVAGIGSRALASKPLRRSRKPMPQSPQMNPDSIKRSPPP